MKLWQDDEARCIILPGVGSAVYGGSRDDGIAGARVGLFVPGFW